ncbi:MAG TPA: 4Fe-4S binding protein [Planctomycetota bacterium]|jgi:formate hydrogenlyase subunit 6/NADH:ubiquinone oxidoreductase subunit I
MIEFMNEVYDGLSTFMTGMKVTAGYLKGANTPSDTETVITIAYDGSEALAREVKVADRFRGHLHNDIERCIVCKACAKACPIDCFWIDGEKTEAGKFRPSRFDIDLLKCMYCGLCVNVCPTGCLTMTKEWWGSTFSRDDGTNVHGQMRHFGVGYYSPEEKIEVERKRFEAAEAKKKAAAASKAAMDAKKKAEAAGKAAGPAPTTIPAPTSANKSGRLAAIRPQAMNGAQPEAIVGVPKAEPTPVVEAGEKKE